VRLVITGATGFIGTHLIPVLSASGHEIAILTRSSVGTRPFASVGPIHAYKLDTYAGILQAIEDFQPDAVIHLATLYLNNHQPEDIPSMIQSNLTFGTQVLEAMSSCGIGRFLNFGTRWQHLHQEKEHAANLYAATKNAFQDILSYYQHQYGISFTTLELCDTFGKGDPRKKIVELMVQACVGRSELALSPGEQVLDLISIDDLTAYIAEGLEKDDFFHNEVIALSGEQVRLRDLGTIVETLFNVSGYLKWGERQYRENEVMSPPMFSRIQKISRKPLESQLREQYLKE